MIFFLVLRFSFGFFLFFSCSGGAFPIPNTSWLGSILLSKLLLLFCWGKSHQSLKKFCYFWKSFQNASKVFIITQTGHAFQRCLAGTENSEIPASPSGRKLGKSIIATSQEHHCQTSLVFTKPAFVSRARLIITRVEMAPQILQKIIWLCCFYQKWEAVPRMTDMVPWIGFVFNEVIVIRRKTRRTDIPIMKINHGHKVPELGWQFPNS